MNKDKIVIFGAGKIGEKFVYEYYDKINICCFWDNKKDGELLGYPVYKPECDKHYLIIVALDDYLNVREQLIRMGYHEFSDFMPYQIFRKKIAVAYGNCHMEAIKKYLSCHKEFSLEYGFYPFPSIQVMKGMQFEFHEILKNCDLLFHQSIRRDNVYGLEFSSENIVQSVKGNCKIISIPNLYGMPKYLFPQLYTKYDGVIGKNPPFFIDRNIVEWLNNGKTKEEMVNYISQGGVYSKIEILNMWENFKQRLFEREREWDIKISDYILYNHRQEKIFCDTNHITSRTAKEIASRVLKFMGYNMPISMELNTTLDALEVFVYQDVIEALDLGYKEKFIRKASTERLLLNDYEMNLEKYVEQLCHYTRFLKRCKNRVIAGM